MKISIITTSFNSAATIADTLASVRDQTYSDIEHIIIDGKSKDDTLSIVSQFDHVHTLISEEDSGIYDAMNKGIKWASGDVIGILNSDDVYSHNDVLTNVAEKFAADSIDAVYADLIYKDSKLDRTLRTWIAGSFEKNNFLNGWMPPHPTFFVRREKYSELGLFRLDMGSAADYELMLRFLYKNNISVKYLNEITVLMRTGGESNASLSHRLKANKMDALAWRVNGIKPHWYTRWLKPLRKLKQWV